MPPVEAIDQEKMRMAKISANGCRKLAERSIDGPSGEVRHHLVLRSDGVILTAFSMPNHQASSARQRSGYTVGPYFKKESWAKWSDEQRIAKFNAHAEAHATFIGGKLL